MNILYLGSFFPKSRYEEILSNSIGVIQNAGDTYQKAILAGLSQHLNSYKIITSPLIGSYPSRYKSIFFKESRFEFNNIKDSICSAFVNLSLYKIYSRYYYSKKKILQWAKNTSGNKYIIIFALDLSLLRASYEIKMKFPDIKLCLIVTDLYRFMVVPNSIITKFIMQYLEKSSLKYIKEVDSFVLLSKYMRDDLKVLDRPYIIIEGIYDPANSTNLLNLEKEQFKTILYSGTLAKQYGIIHLLNAFSKIREEDYRLWICGEGDAKEDILKRAKDDNRIKYFGQLKREEVTKLQKMATVLVNPRLSDKEFTLYSFPSKTMEYLASGTPTIMHPLGCLPKEYLDHLFIAKDESDQGLMNTIVEVCDKTQEELIAFGELAATFILNEKNSTTQVSKIIKLLNHEK